MAIERQSPWSQKQPDPRPEYDREDPKQFATDITRHPQGGGAMNREIQERRETEKQTPVAQPERTRDVVQEDTTDRYLASNFAVRTRELQGELGQTANEVIAAADSFLNEGVAEIGGMSGQGGVKYDSTTGQFEIQDAGATPDFSQLAEEKFGQLQRLREQSGLFFTQNEETGQWEPREFSEVLTEYYDDLNPDSKMRVDVEADKLISLAQKINRLEEVGEGESAEAYSLRRQLELEDKNGLVTGLYRAKKQVEDLLSGETSFLGDEGDEGYTVADLLNLERDEIEDELRRAAASSSGLFGGDFEAAIEQVVDRESAEYRKFLEEDRDFRNTLGRAGRNYFSEMKRRFTQAAGEIKNALGQITPEIMESMGESVDAELSREWFTALQTGSDEDFADVMSDLIYDPNSGIAAADRRQLAAYVGDILQSRGIDLGVDGDSALLSDAISELESTGQITWVDENGREVTVKPTGIDKERIVIAMDKGEKALKEEFKQLVNRQGIRLDQTLQQITDDGSYGSIERAAQGFRNAIVGSLATFKGSESEEALGYAASQAMGLTGDQFNSLSEADKSQLMLNYLASNPQVTEDLIKTKIADAQGTFEAQKRTLEGQFQTLGKTYNDRLKQAETALEGNTSTRQSALDSFNDYKGSIDTGMQSLAQKQLNSLRGTQQVYDLMQSGALTEDELKDASDLLAKMEYLRLLQEQNNDFYDSVEKNLPRQHRDFLKEFVQADYSDASIGNQLSYRNRLAKKLIESAAEGDPKVVGASRVYDAAFAKLRPQDVASMADYLSQVDGNRQTINRAITTYSGGLQEIDQKRNLLGELDGQFRTTLEGMVNPQEIGRVAQIIANQLEEGGASREAVNLGGFGQRQDLVGNVDPLQTRAANIPQTDYAYQQQALENDLSEIDLDRGVTATGLGQFDAGTVEDIRVGKSKDKLILQNPQGGTLVGDLVTGAVFDEEGNRQEGYFVNPMTGQLTDDEGKETGDFYRTTFDSRWLDDPGIADEVGGLSGTQRTLVAQMMEDVARENVDRAEGQGVPPDELKDVIGEGAKAARFMKEKSMVGTKDFVEKAMMVDDATGGGYSGGHLTRIVNKINDGYVRAGTSLEDEAKRIAEQRAMEGYEPNMWESALDWIGIGDGPEVSKQDVDKVIKEIVEKDPAVRMMSRQQQEAANEQDRQFSEATRQLMQAGYSEDDAEIEALMAMDENGNIDEGKIAERTSSGGDDFGDDDFDDTGWDEGKKSYEREERSSGLRERSIGDHNPFGRNVAFDI